MIPKDLQIIITNSGTQPDKSGDFNSPRSGQPTEHTGPAGALFYARSWGVSTSLRAKFRTWVKV